MAPSSVAAAGGGTTDRSTGGYVDRWTPAIGRCRRPGLRRRSLPESAQHSIRARYAESRPSLTDLAEEYRVGRSTIHRVIHGGPAAVGVTTWLAIASGLRAMADELPDAITYPGANLRGSTLATSENTIAFSCCQNQQTHENAMISRIARSRCVPGWSQNTSATANPAESV